LLIGAGVAILLIVLAFSIMNMGQGAKEKVVNTYLEQAQQEEVLGNQQDLPAAERQQHLQQAIALGKQAVEADPQSDEAALLVQKAQASLDALQGITRLETTLLFDLNEVDKTAPPAQTEGDGLAASAGEQPANVGQLGAIVVQSNEAYVLDKEKGRVYRCRVSAQECSVVLQSGESAGGQKVGSLLAMTLRVGSLVVLDSNLVSFAFAADTSTWEAQPLGAADSLNDPKEIASYDGNLYLLGAKQGQISKYPSGAYGEVPQDWVQDPASVEQLKNPVSFGIDGVVYVLLEDGKIQVMQGGKITRTLSPERKDGAHFGKLFTSTDTQDIYLLDSTGGVTRVSKEGQLIATYRAGSGSEGGTPAAITVDEGRGKLYLLEGRKVYEATLGTKQPGADASVPGGVQPSEPLAPQPTAEP
jgi:hypothetical protein